LKAVCHNQFCLESLFGKEMADFSGGRIPSDAGGLLLRELNGRSWVSDMDGQYLKGSRVPGRRDPAS
jgi:hypothetical protein